MGHFRFYRDFRFRRNGREDPPGVRTHLGPGQPASPKLAVEQAYQHWQESSLLLIVRPFSVVAVQAYIAPIASHAQPGWVPSEHDAELRHQPCAPAWVW